MKLTKRQVKRFRRIRRLSQMKQMDPVEFEEFTGWLYERRGYRASTTAISGDEGIDLVLRRWGKKIIVQCKRYAGNVGQPIVRDLYGAMIHSGAGEAHLVTTGTISQQAEDWAAGKPIVLVDGSDLVAWVNKSRRKGKKRKGVRTVLLTPTRVALILVLLALIAASVWGARQENVRTQWAALMERGWERAPRRGEATSIPTAIPTTPAQVPTTPVQAPPTPVQAPTATQTVQPMQGPPETWIYMPTIFYASTSE
jgi:restriction system protein